MISSWMLESTLSGVGTSEKQQKSQQCSVSNSNPEPLLFGTDFPQSSRLPENWYRGVFMQIYVRGYKDSDGDGIGDLKGVTEKLD